MKNSIRKIIRITVITAAICMGIWGNAFAADACKVLVVSSYHDSFFRALEINEGIEEVLGAECDLTYAYLNALAEPENIKTRAEEALQQYQTLQPDGVIAMGEEAQSFFVVPHLRDKVETPVMFNNIFFPEVYEYPASNVSGITVHWPMKEAIAFMQQVMPEVKTVSVLCSDEPSSDALIEQISREKDSYPLPLVEPVVAKTLDEAVKKLSRLKGQCDALYIGTTGLLLSFFQDAASPESAFIATVKKAFGNALFTNLQFYVETGVVCGVKDFGQEQGQVAAEMLQKAMSGTPLADLPITQNQFEQRILNKTVLKEMGIKPSRQLLTGTKIVETRK